MKFEESRQNKDEREGLFAVLTCTIEEGGCCTKLALDKDPTKDSIPPRPFSRLTFRWEMEQLDLHALSMSILILDVSNKFLPLAKTPLVKTFHYI